MSLPKETMEILQALAPELAESEDERIRRWLCDYFSSIDKAWIHKDITCIDILRWLEKQKEQKKEKFPPYVTGFKGHPDPAGTSDLEEAAEKYIQGSMCDLDDGPSTGLAKESFIAGAKWQKEQKSAEWSEDDENVYKTIMDDFNGITPMSKAYKLKAAKWLKSILERCSLQPKQEWSEEDERIRKAILGFVNPDKGGTKYSSYAELVKWSDWLKSLRPSWKPSEEQMKALQNAVALTACDKELARLYNQLEKL